MSPARVPALALAVTVVSIGGCAAPGLAAATAAPMATPATPGPGPTAPPAASATSAIPATLAAAGSRLDLVIRGGRIVDGTGNPAFSADVGIVNGRIATVGFLLGKSPGPGAARIIDAAGLVVAPGFVDIHNHSDDTVMVDPELHSMLRQGVTTMVFGENRSAAPSKAFPRFSDYFARLRATGISANLGSYIGSGQVWTEVRGPRAGPPTAAELDKMRALVEQAMQDGALGVASQLGFPPGVWIDTDTLVAMCEVAARYGGRYSTHLRTEGIGIFESVAEALDIGRRARVPVDLIHLKLADHTLWGKMADLIATIAAERARGFDVQANVYPYRAGQNNLSALIPPWAQEGGKEAMLARLNDPGARIRMAGEILGATIPGWYDHYTAIGNWDGMQLVRFKHPAHKKFEGKRMSEVVKTIGGKPIDVLFDLLLANDGSVPTIYFHHDENDMRHALRQPFVSIGSDGTAVKVDGPLAAGNPHPRYYGTFPRVLGRYVREERLLTIEDAVRKMTSANTAKVQVFDRGLLRPGQWADVTIFDPTTVIDNATYDKPAQYPTGIEYVIVNGTVVVEKGRHTGARPGAVVLGPGKK